MTRLRAGGPRNSGSISGRGKIFFCTPQCQYRLCISTEPPGQCVPPVNRPVREVDHSPSSSAEINPLNTELNPICQ